jgi:hypothetical protein
LKKPQDLGVGWHAVTNEIHQNLGAITSTSLKMFDVSPFRYYHTYILKDKPSQPYKPAFKIGTAVHMLLLEPELAKSRLLVCDNTPTSIKYKNFVEENVPDLVADHPENSGGRYITKDGSFYYVFNTEEMQMINKMVENGENHKFFTKLRTNAQAEITGLACENTPDGEEWLTCRGDLRGTLPNGEGYFVDIKTLDSIGEHAIQSQITSLGYLMQQMHYLYVANKIEPDKYKHFYFFFMEKQYPNECALVYVDLTQEEDANLRNYYQKMLNKLLTAKVNNTFEKFDKDKCAMIKLPGWYANKIRY